MSSLLYGLAGEETADELLTAMRQAVDEPLSRPVPAQNGHIRSGPQKWIFLRFPCGRYGIS